MASVSFERPAGAAVPVVQDHASEPRNQKHLQWSEVKTKKVWLNVLASIVLAAAFVAGTLAFTASLWYAAPAILLLAAGAFLVVCSCRLVDYEDEKTIAKFRKEAPQMPMMSLEKKHGWEKLFQYEILSPAQFNESYLKHADTLSLNELMTCHENATQGLASARSKISPQRELPFQIPEPRNWKEKLQSEFLEGLDYLAFLEKYSLPRLIRHSLISSEELSTYFTKSAHTLTLKNVILAYEKTNALLHAAAANGYDLPSPELWKHKFAEETHLMSCSEILSRYNVKPQSLREYNIITEEEFAIFQRAENAIAQSNLQIQEYEAEFERRTQKDRKLCARAKEAARKSYEANPAHHLLNDLYWRYISDRKACEKLARTEKSAEESMSKLALIDQRHALQLQLLKSQHDREEFALQQTLSSAKTVRDEACSLADQHYELAIQPVRFEIDQRISEHRAHLAANLARLDQEYANFRSAA